MPSIDRDLHDALSGDLTACRNRADSIAVNWGYKSPQLADSIGDIARRAQIGLDRLAAATVIAPPAPDAGPEPPPPPSGGPILTPSADLADVYQTAAPGSIWFLAAGDYGSVTFPAGDKGGRAVTFRAAPEADVRASAQIFASDLILDGFTRLALDIQPGAKRVSILRTTEIPAKLFIGNGEDILISGFTVQGSQKGEDGIMLDGSRITLENGEIRDCNRHRWSGTGAAPHTDAVQFRGGRDVTLRRLRVENCGPQGIFANPQAPGSGDPRFGSISGLVVEDITIGMMAEGYYGLRITNTSGTIIRRIRSVPPWYVPAANNPGLVAQDMERVSL